MKLTALSILFALFAGAALAAGPDALSQVQAQKLRERAHIRALALRPAGSHHWQEAEAPFENDQATNLVDELRTQSLAEMDAQGLTKARLAEEPWSDTYWPIYAGELADRYSDSAYVPSLSWDDNERFLIGQLGKGPVAQLSPAEKYDLILGDRDFTLSRAMIEEGKPYFDSNGSVETWMGICHGWSPASFMMKRPRHSVKVLAADGRTEVELYPADIRGLASLLWANGNFETKFIGGRCNDEHPPLDPHGRPTSQDCRDTNPGTWHLAVVNQIGVAKRSFIIDADWSIQVWNQPVVGYSYIYANARTGAPVAKLADALQPVDDQDPHRALRAPDAANYVRVIMNLTYATERSPSNAASDSAAQDRQTTVKYDYELELDASGNIVGGEWTRNFHPDFLWLPVKDTQVHSAGDDSLDSAGDHSSWEQGTVIPKSWRDAAEESTRAKQPLARVVQQLIDWAN